MAAAEVERPFPLSREDLLDAHRLLADVLEPTPLEYSRWLSALVGGPVFLKCENLQRTGSFKLRGAYVRMSRMPEEQKRKGVVAASAGNHAQGVALAASLLDMHATVFMPNGAPIPKETATRAYGAEIRFVGTTIDDCLEAARAYEAETGAVLIHPFDHTDIVAGQASAGLEIAEQCPQARTLVVPVGGGGVAAGIALAYAEAVPRDLVPTPPTVIGVQAAAAAAYPASLAAGHPVPLDSMATMADGIAVGRPGQVPFDVIARHVAEVRTVAEGSLSRAVLATLERGKLLVEPAGAAGVAALLDAPHGLEPPVVVVLSGGNIDPVLLMRVIQHGMAEAGRYLSLRVTVPDVPGGLAGMLAMLAESDANVLEVTHDRISPRLQPDEVDVWVQLETRGQAHAERVVAQLRDCGYAVSSAELP